MPHVSVTCHKFVDKNDHYKPSCIGMVRLALQQLKMTPIFYQTLDHAYKSLGFAVGRTWKRFYRVLTGLCHVPRTHDKLADSGSESCSVFDQESGMSNDLSQWILSLDINQMPKTPLISLLVHVHHCHICIRLCCNTFHTTTPFTLHIRLCILVIRQYPHIFHHQITFFNVLWLSLLFLLSIQYPHQTIWTETMCAYPTTFYLCSVTIRDASHVTSYLQFTFIPYFPSNTHLPVTLIDMRQLCVLLHRITLSTLGLSLPSHLPYLTFQSVITNIS